MMEEKVKILSYGLKGNGEYLDEWKQQDNQDPKPKRGRPKKKRTAERDSQHFWFGKYRGELVTDVRSEYLRWFYANIKDRKDPVLPTIEKTMKARGEKLIEFKKYGTNGKNR